MSAPATTSVEIIDEVEKRALLVLLTAENHGSFLEDMVFTGKVWGQTAEQVGAAVKRLKAINVVAVTRREKDFLRRQYAYVTLVARDRVSVVLMWESVQSAPATTSVEITDGLEKNILTLLLARESYGYALDTAVHHGKKWGNTPDEVEEAVKRLEAMKIVVVDQQRWGTGGNTYSRVYLANRERLHPILIWQPNQ